MYRGLVDGDQHVGCRSYKNCILNRFDHCESNEESNEGMQLVTKEIVTIMYSNDDNNNLMCIMY